MKTNEKKKTITSKPKKVTITKATQLTAVLSTIINRLDDNTIDGKTATTMTKVANSIISNTRNQITYLKTIGSKKKIDFLS